MRYRLMATYRGAPYEAGIGPADGAVVLFAACPPPEELGFEPATGHWRKELRIQDVQAVWQSRPVGMFRGDSCIVLDDLGDRLHIGYLGHDAYRAEQLGYWQVDRGVFELVAGRDEVTDIVEERTDYQPGMSPQASYPPLPAMAAPEHAQPAGQPSSGYPVQSGLSGPGGPGGLSELPKLPGPPDPPPRMPPPNGEVAMPAAGSEPPLPLEAQAMRAASAASRRDQLGAPGPVGPARDSGLYAAPVSAVMPSSAPVPAPRPGPVPPSPAGSYSADGLYSASGYSPAPPAGNYAPAEAYAPGPAVGAPTAVGSPAPPLPGSPAPPVPGGQAPRRRRSGERRMATERIFGELASLAAIPAGSYSVGEEVDGAMCLLETADGFEVFSCAGGARHEVRVFSDEESACFYLFGVLAADAVRTGGLVPGAGRVPAAASVADGLPRR